MERQMKQEAERAILTAAKLISPVIEDSFSAGYNWYETMAINQLVPKNSLKVGRLIKFYVNINYLDKNTKNIIRIINCCRKLYKMKVI